MVAFSVLIEGLDLTGKTTIAGLLVEHLAIQGVPAVHHRGYLGSPRPPRRPDPRRAAGDRPHCRALNAAFLGGAVLDRVPAARIIAALPGVLVQESYVDRAVAYGIAAGRWPLAVAASRLPWLFARFDLAVITHAPAAVRQERLARRAAANAVDRLTTADDDFADRFAEALQAIARRHGTVLVADTSARSPQEIVADLAGRAVAAGRAR